MTSVSSAATTAVMDDETLSGFLAAVQSDPEAVAAGVRARVTESREGNVCMMGGWTSN